jgi:hypothetical protein
LGVTTLQIFLRTGISTILKFIIQVQGGKMKRIFIVILSSLLLMLSSSAYSAVIMENDMESVTTCLQAFTNDVNTYDGGACAISTTYAHSGSNSIRLTYPNDEAGIELKPPPFEATTSLYTRKWEYYDSNWPTNWPVGLKTSRYFTASNWSTGAEPDAYAYASEKLIWQTYGGDASDTYARGMNIAIFNLDLEATYSATIGYIQAGTWNKYETWMVLNSALNAADGVLQVWINDVEVYNNTAVVWRSSARGVPNGTGWQSMWFGGNYSGATFGAPSTTLYRYIDDVYLSTTLDRSADVTAPTLSSLTPSGNVTYGTTKQLSVTTSESSTCRYHASSTTWASMTAMSSTGGTTHTQSVNVSVGANSFKVVCRDAAANESTAGTWSFTVLAEAAGAKTISIGAGSQTISGGGSQTIIMQ